MTIFNTPRLQVQKVKKNDVSFFMELLSAPEIIDPVPQAPMTEEEMKAMFEDSVLSDGSIFDKDRVIWGIYEGDKTELIGLCGVLTNDEGQREVAYRLRKKYWGVGYGTEVTKYLIDYCFDELKLETLAADANIENMGSVKILEKYFTAVRDFFNEKENCTDRRFILKKEDWTARFI